MSALFRLLLAALRAKPGVLPPPDGRYPVGTCSMSCTDARRTGLFRQGEARIVPMRLWYPAAAAGGAPAPFLPGEEAARRFSQSMHLPPVFNRLGTLPTNSTEGAPPAEGGPFPVLLFSHGYGSFYGQNSQQMEHLASHGYVVASVSHLYECFWPPTDGKNQTAIDEMREAVKKAGGKSDTPEAMRRIIEDCPAMLRSAEIWADDMSFAFDSLRSSPWGERLDLRRFGAFGHSFGGAAAGELSLRDPRCVCFANLDGAFFCSLARRCTAVPFLLITSKNQVSSCLLPEQRGYVHVEVSDARHFDFSDLPLALPSFKKSGLLGPIDSLVLRNLLNDWLLAYFDRHLRGISLPEELKTRWSGIATVADMTKPGNRRQED